MHIAACRLSSIHIILLVNVFDVIRLVSNDKYDCFSSKTFDFPIFLTILTNSFSTDGNFLYAIQSARRGATHLVE